MAVNCIVTHNLHGPVPPLILGKKRKKEEKLAGQAKENWAPFSSRSGSATEHVCIYYICTTANTHILIQIDKYFNNSSLISIKK